MHPHTAARGSRHGVCVRGLAWGRGGRDRCGGATGIPRGCTRVPRPHVPRIGRCLGRCCWVVVECCLPRRVFEKRGGQWRQSGSAQRQHSGGTAGTEARGGDVTVCMPWLPARRIVLRWCCDVLLLRCCAVLFCEVLLPAIGTGPRSVGPCAASREVLYILCAWCSGRGAACVECILLWCLSNLFSCGVCRMYSSVHGVLLAVPSVPSVPSVHMCICTYVHMYIWLVHDRWQRVVEVYAHISVPSWNTIPGSSPVVDAMTVIASVCSV